MDRIKRKILTHLRHKDYKAVKAGDFAKSLGLKKEDEAVFKKAFSQLQKEGQIVIGSNAMVSLPPMSGKIIGIFRSTSKGFGFVCPTEKNSHGDLFIPAEYTLDAISGDTVAAKIMEKSGRDRRISGKIVEIVQRANNRFVGTLIQRPDGFYLLPDGKFAEQIFIGDASAKGAEENDKAVAEIISFPKGNRPASGVIIELLGKSGTYKTETDAVIRRFSLPQNFPADCIAQASKAAEKFGTDDLQGRIDLTNKTIVTIDPPDAKDFDDAISIDKNSDGSWTLGVHIADVSHFIEEGSPLDIEAKGRGNSVYLPNLVLPMLPEVLSNGICSLQPGQKRFAKSAFITYDKDANVLKTDFANTVICSTARLTYLQADKILKGAKSKQAVEVISLLKDMEHLAKRIEARRRTAGMLHLDLSETELIFDKSGLVIDAEPAENSYPHTIIEMFMVEANETVGNLFDRLNVSFIRRIHPDPDSLSLKSLSKTLRLFGINISKNPDRFDLQTAINLVKGKPASFAANTYILRSLARAEYSPLNIGHFALASRHYCHFTSPIRRYADLHIHRLLDDFIKMGAVQSSETEDELIELGRHLSFTDRRAEEAEDDLKTVLILQLFAKRLGEELDTVISGLANFGIFVQCIKFGIEGLIPLDLLGGDRFIYDHNAQCVYGQKSGRMFHIGMPLRAKIVSVNLAARQMNLIPAENKEQKPANKKHQNRGKRKK